VSSIPTPDHLGRSFSCYQANAGMVSSTYALADTYPPGLSLRCLKAIKFKFKLKSCFKPPSYAYKFS